jgi:hypothetical protein
MNRWLATAGLLLAPGLLSAQLLKLDQLDRLAAKASETVNVTLDGSLLQLAGRFLDDDGGDSAEVKKLVSGLRGITVRSFEFKGAGEYTDADIEAVRSQLRDVSWKRIVQVHSKTEGDTDVYLKTTAGKVDGVVVIAAEPKEFTVVAIEGPVDVDGLAKLAGNFGIPKSVRKKAEEKAK